jgi:hypothetical protein
MALVFNKDAALRVGRANFRLRMDTRFFLSGRFKSQRVRWDF